MTNELQGYTVRIDKGTDPDSYVFAVTCVGPPSTEFVGLDSTPGIIALVNATSPGDACDKAWQRGISMYDRQWKELAP